MLVKGLAKSAAFALAILLTLPLWLLSQLQSLLLRSHGLFRAMSAFLSLFPGKTGSYLRVAFHWITLERCARTCCIEFGTFFPDKRVVIGNGVYIGARSIIGKCCIGDYTLIGSNVDIVAGKHQHFFSDPDKLICEQGGTFEQISIGTDCWIGNGSIIMADVGDRCIVGAGSVVTKPLEKNCVAAGVPARVISSRPTTTSTA